MAIVGICVCICVQPLEIVTKNNVTVGSCILVDDEPSAPDVGNYANKNGWKRVSHLRVTGDQANGRFVLDPAAVFAVKLNRAKDEVYEDLIDEAARKLQKLAEQNHNFVIWHTYLVERQTTQAVPKKKPPKKKAKK
jgi:hypothetical protein